MFEMTGQITHTVLVKVSGADEIFSFEKRLRRESKSFAFFLILFLEELSGSNFFESFKKKHVQSWQVINIIAKKVR